MHNRLVIAFTLLLATLLAILPLPDWMLWLRPAWVLMVLMYWTMTSPHQVGLSTAWGMGILLDLLTGTLLGEHALAFTIIIYFVTKIHIRWRMYPSLQQGISILFFVLGYQFILYCIQGFLGDLPSSHLYWLSSVTSMLLWPWLFVLLRDCSRWFKVT